MAVPGTRVGAGRAAGARRTRTGGVAALIAAIVFALVGWTSAPAAAAEGEFELAQLFGNQNQQALADVSVRVDRVEGQMRTITGQLEELSFQIRQLQEQLRRIQEDNEYRFQQLEGGTAPKKKTELAPPAVVGGETTVAGFSDPSAPPAAVAPVAGATGGDIAAPPASLGTLSLEDQPAGSYDPASGPLDLTAMTNGGAVAPEVPAATAAPQEGGVLPGIGGAGQAITDAPAPAAPGARVAAIPGTANAREIYDGAYNYVLRGEYPQAEVEFRRFLEAYPNDRLVPDAQYWLGETLFARADYRDAAQSFLKSYSEHPDSRKAPDALFKLGLSLAGMGEREAACASYSELLQRYASTSQVLKDRVRSEQKSLKC